MWFQLSSSVPCELFFVAVRLVVLGSPTVVWLLGELLAVSVASVGARVMFSV